MCHSCVSECGRCLALGDGHDHCLTCLGSKHAEVAFVDESSSHCGCSYRSCGQVPLPRQRGGALLPSSRSSSRPGCREARSTSGGSKGGLRITVVANSQGTIAPLALRNQLSCQWNVLNHAFFSGPVGTRLVSPAMLMWSVEMLPPPYATALLQVLQAKSTEGHARGWSRSGSSERAPYCY